MFFIWSAFVCSLYEKHQLQDKSDRFIANGNKSLQSAARIWSTAYHQIACGATQRLHTNHICSAYDPAAMPYSTLRPPGQHSRDSRALLWGAFMEKNESGWGRNARHEGWDWGDGKWRRRGEMTAPRQLSVIDLCWICLASALLKHERVLQWSLPDDGLHDDISLPDDHVTYKTLRGVLTRNTYPLSILRVIVLMSLLRFHPAYPLASNLRLPYHVKEHIILTVEHTCAPACVHKWIHVLTTQSVRVVYKTYCSISVSERKQVPLVASKVPLITQAAMRRARPADGTVCL